MKKVLLVCGLLLPSCLTACGLGDGNRNVIENNTNINCNANIYTSVVPAESVLEKMTSLEDLGADVLRSDLLPTGEVAITYSIEQCNGNGNIDQSETNDTQGDTHIEGR